MRTPGTKKTGMKLPSGYLASNTVLLNCQKTFQNVIETSFQLMHEYRDFLFICNLKYYITKNVSYYIRKVLFIIFLLKIHESLTQGVILAGILASKLHYRTKKPENK